MAKIYHLLIGKGHMGDGQINDVYRDRDDAIENARQLVRDTGMRVTVWEAEEIEGMPVDIRDWMPLITFRF